MKSVDKDLLCLIVGLGSTGRRHLANLASLGYHNFVVVSRGRCPLPNDKLPAMKIVPKLEEALALKPKAAFVCNPTSLHLSTALAAAQSGCHLFLEKPLSHNWQGVDELQQLVLQQQLAVRIGFQFRCHPVLQRIKALLDTGALGNIVAVQAHWGEYLPNWHPWEDYRQSYSARRALGGGVLLTLCHPFDYLRWLIGEVKTVYATAGRSPKLGIEAEDHALVSLDFENGTIGQVHLDYLQDPARHQLHIIGEQGKIEWDYYRGNAIVHYHQPKAMELLPLPAQYSRNDLFVEELKDFMKAVHFGGSTQCNLMEGAESLRLTLAASASAQSRTAINLNQWSVEEFELTVSTNLS
ncbi:MAG: Gfo/Idh/MocA family oxidoreductase [Bacteroidota bacterium]